MQGHAVKIFTLEPGRNIYLNGQPFIAIKRCGRAYPTEADDMARRLVVLMNKFDTGPLPEGWKLPED